MFSARKTRIGAILRIFRIVSVAVACFAGGSFHAQSLEAARMAYDAGDFLEAADMAAGLNTADGYALAANSLAVYGFHIAAPGQEREDIFARATDYGLEAVRLEPQNVQAHLQLAHAMGRYAQVVGVVEVLGNRYVTRVRDAVETAAELDPESAMAHLGIAAWHAEALGKAGIIARLLFGASSARALEHIDLALEYGPELKVVQLETGYSLLLLSERRYGDRALRLLRAARELPIGNAWDEFLHERTLEMLADLSEC